MTTSASPTELNTLLESNSPCQIMDVRSFPEFASGHLRGARLLPLADLPGRLGEIARSQRVILVCRTGKRSAEARRILTEAGFADACELAGGIDAWQAAGLPLVKAARVPWALERQVRIAAGSLVLLGVILGFAVHPAFFGLCAFVGAGLVFAGLTDWCGMGLLLARMPWNRPPRESCD